MSTILKELSGVIIANEIRLHRAVFSGCFLLVEGVQDANLFEKFVQRESCFIQTCNGKPNLVDAISILDEDCVPGILGVCDRDFGEILGYEPKKGTIVYTDENDIEIMILCSTALRNILIEFGVNDKIKEIESAVGKPIEEQIFEVASFLWAMRLISYRERLKLSFKGMRYCFEPRTFKLDKVQTVHHILKKSDKLNEIEKSDLLSRIQKEQEKRKDSRKICCGHDCVRILGQAFRNSIGNLENFKNQEGANHLSKILRLAYGHEEFIQTGLYAFISSWEVDSGYKVLRNVI